MLQFFFISYFYTFVKDFEACAQALHRLGYSCPRLTAATGTSAGGLIIGAVCNRSPELVKAVILKVSCSFVFVCFLCLFVFVFCGYRVQWIIGNLRFDDGNINDNATNQ